MPTYEYECTKCQHHFEKFQSMKDKPLQKCPECRGKVRRLLGAGAGIIFKGSGFYETDYKKKSSGGGESKPSKTSSTTDSKSKTTSIKKD
ncbi:MAG: FmdB family transcriptional regulator [Lentisphaerae bacterium RIFOXYA12_FULL_48_11]|nr:MAG: FmdB family transcriptional regulator [Lentisphaerae bacterium RIFOXYA12_FULL_48_11]